MMGHPSITHPLANHIGSLEAAKRLGLTERRIRQLCEEGRLLGAAKIGGSWVIPAPLLIERRVLT